MTEAIIFVCTVIGTIVAYLTFIQPEQDFKELKQLTIEKLELLKKINNYLLYEIEGFASKYDCYTNEFMQGISFQQGINLLKTVSDEINQEDVELSIQGSKTKGRIEEIKKHLETQIHHHSEVKTYYELFVKPTM